MRESARATARRTHVERFDVAMRQAALVDVPHGFDHLPHHRADGVQPRSLLLIDLQEVAVGLVHHESACAERDVLRQMLLDKLAEPAFEVLDGALEIVIGRRRERQDDKPRVERALLARAALAPPLLLVLHELDDDRSLLADGFLALGDEGVLGDGPVETENVRRHAQLGGGALELVRRQEAVAVLHLLEHDRVALVRTGVDEQDDDSARRSVERRAGDEAVCAGGARHGARDLVFGGATHIGRERGRRS